MPQIRVVTPKEPQQARSVTAPRKRIRADDRLQERAVVVFAETIVERFEVALIRN